MNHPISESDIRRITQATLQTSDIKILASWMGTINWVVKVQTPDRVVALRVRIHENIYRYEKDVVKEAFIDLLSRRMPNLEKSANTADSLQAEVQNLPNFFKCQNALTGNEWIPLLAWDWSRKIIPYPYLIYDWIEGAPLWSTPDKELYFQAGQNLAEIHAVQFSSPSESLIPFVLTGESLEKHFKRSFETPWQTLVPHLSQPAQKKIEDFIQICASNTKTFATASPCLIHNDYSGGNILIHNGRFRAVIDWDNAQIGVAELDFQKMKHWTVFDTTQHLVPNSEFFASFREGYRQACPHHQDNPSLELLYEILWLCRVFDFEFKKEQNGLTVTQGYPSKDFYLNALIQLSGYRKLIHFLGFSISYKFPTPAAAGQLETAASQAGLFSEPD